MNQHTFRIELERTGETEPLDGGTITVTGRDYDAYDEHDALADLMSGSLPEQLDLTLPGFVRWRGHLMPAGDFRRLSLTLVAKAKAPAGE